MRVLSPICTSGPTTVWGPISTSAPSSAPGAITAVGWIFVATWVPRFDLRVDHGEHQGGFADELARDRSRRADLGDLALAAQRLDLEPELVPGDDGPAELDLVDRPQD